MIRIDGLTYNYPEAEEPALGGVSLALEEGAFVLVTGPSGGGKSTLLRCLNGLVPHFSGGTVSGSIDIAGNDPIAAGPQVMSRVVGFVFQDPEAQFVVDRVEDEVAFALENAGVSPDEMRARVGEALELVGLTHLSDRDVTTLSGGEKQRVAIAATLALRPRILVLDEPTSQLDPESAAEVLDALVRLNRMVGLTVVLAEHRLERVLPYVDRVVSLEGGALTCSGPPSDVLAASELVPPLVVLGKALGWSPLPVTMDAARPFASEVALSVAPFASPPPTRPMLVVEDLHYAYGRQGAIAGVDVTVGAGEVVALMGRNGAGKTTLLRCIVGLLRPQRGRVALDGRDLVGRDTADICREVGYLPQTPDDLLFAETVGEELAVTLRNHGLLGNPPIPPDHLIAQLGLAPIAGRYPRDLSVGQRQRVALGAITVTQPRLLLLDEPTRGLDYRAKHGLVDLLTSWQSQGAGIVLTTHDVELAAQVADRLVILEGGRVVADGALRELAGSSVFTPQVAELFPGTGLLTPGDVLRAHRTV